jgi:FAD dependent oxidoreductase
VQALEVKQPHRRFRLILLMLGLGISTALSLGYLHKRFSQPKISLLQQTAAPTILTPQGLTKFTPTRTASEVWECDVVVVGGSLGGVAAASGAMRQGAKTCLIELTPWLGGQISSGGVPAMDESLAMRAKENYSKTWIDFKQLIKQQPAELPAWSNSTPLKVADINSCWVAKLCFPPKAGARASEKLLQSSSANAAGSRWSTSTAFKGATFDSTGKQITAIYAVRRVNRNLNYKPKGGFLKN